MLSTVMDTRGCAAPCARVSMQAVGHQKMSGWTGSSTACSQGLLCFDAPAACPAGRHVC